MFDMACVYRLRDGGPPADVYEYERGFITCRVPSDLFLSITANVPCRGKEMFW